MPENKPVMDVELYDTTLRDGTQREGMSLSADDKLRLALRLDRFGMRYIEAGWPGSNPKDAEFFIRARGELFQKAALVAFGATRRSDRSPGEDESLRAMLAAETPVCTIFGKSWPLHVTECLRTSLDENLAMIGDTVAWLREHRRKVVYDAEHFFDGYRDDASYAVSTLEAAARGGAEVLVLCDTNGGSLPWEVAQVVREVRGLLAERLGQVPKLGIHAHDDAGCAVANSLAAVQAGAEHVQGTLNGYGERCGNANLCTIAADLEIKMGQSCLPSGRLGELYELSHFAAEVANIRPNAHAPYVGRSAFAHKGGVHVAAMRRNERSYEHIDPAVVGNSSRVVVSELAGRGNVRSKAEEFQLSLDPKREHQVLLAIKEGEARGFSYEAAEASVLMLARRADPTYRAPFQLRDYQVLVGQRRDSELVTEATVKVDLGGETFHTVADGNGPVAALDKALRLALRHGYAALRHIHLSGYKVRILDAEAGTSAMIRVLVDFHDESDAWSTVGASTNVIEASVQALVDGVEYGLVRHRPSLAS